MVYSRERQSFYGNSFAVFIVPLEAKASSCWHLSIYKYICFVLLQIKLFNLWKRMDLCVNVS